MQILFIIAIILGVYFVSVAACLTLGRLINKSENFSLNEDDLLLCFIPLINTFFAAIVGFVTIISFIASIIIPVLEYLWEKITPNKKFMDIIRDFFYNDYN